MKRKTKAQTKTDAYKISNYLDYCLQKAFKQRDVVLQVKLTRAIIAFNASVGTPIFNKIMRDDFNDYMNNYIQKYDS